MSRRSSASIVARRTSASDGDRKSTRLNSSHTEIYPLSLHDALPISDRLVDRSGSTDEVDLLDVEALERVDRRPQDLRVGRRSEEHTSELQSHRDLPSFPTRRSSDLRPTRRPQRVHR